MATAYLSPIDPPRFNAETWRQDEDNYIEKCRAICRENGDHPLLGEVVKWGRADGYAVYMVYNVKPLQLIHLAIGDAYQVEDALIRGLRPSDVEQMIRYNNLVANLPSGKEGDDA